MKFSDNYATLMSPSNIQAFFTNMESKNYGAVLKRFKLDNSAQADALYSYFKYVISNHLSLKYMDGDYKNNAFA